VDGVTQGISIDPRTDVGAVSLVVADLPSVRGFYEDAIGLAALEEEGDAVRLGAGTEPVVELIGVPSAPQRLPGTTGLFHLAIRVPSRAELARALRRVLDAGWRFSGASDHLVSEALYLADPEGNGIEIYWDRPREEWPRRNGEIEMDSLPLDLDGLMAELSGDAPGGRIAEGTGIGHVHLNVGDLGAAEGFYVGVLGFDVTVRDYPGALFFSAGGYHHHIGVNTWAGEGAPPPPPGSRGLRNYEIVLPDAEQLAGAEERLSGAGVDADLRDGAIELSDPSGNGVLLRT
jgi:catechol 2,3-dioxygenase